MSKKFAQSDKVKLLRPKAGRVPLHPGQHDTAAGIQVVRNGERAFLKFDQVFQVSENTKAQIVNDASGLPLINADFVNHVKNKSRFKLIEPIKNEDNDE